MIFISVTLMIFTEGYELFLNALFLKCSYYLVLPRILIRGLSVFFLIIITDFAFTCMVGLLSCYIV